MPESIPTRLDDLIANQTPVRVGDRHSQWAGRIVAYSSDPTILLEALDGRRVMLPTSFEISELSGEELRVYNATKETDMPEDIPEAPVALTNEEIVDRASAWSDYRKDYAGVRGTTGDYRAFRGGWDAGYDLARSRFQSRETFVPGPTEPTRENTGTGLMSDAEVEQANGHFGYLRRISAGHRLFTYDLNTGDVSLPSAGLGITGDEGAHIAASVLPGLTAEQVATFYAEWLNADEDPRQPAPDDDETSQAMVATLPLMLMDEMQVTFRREVWERSGSPSVSMPREQWVNLGSPVTITVTIKPAHS